jgi:hypothetical protein
MFGQGEWQWAARRPACLEKIMDWVVNKMKWIMLTAGVLTCTMVYAAIAPQAALLATFGETLQGPLAELVVRSWGVLITLVGAMLVYGAFHPEQRALVLVVAGISKLAFAGLVLSHGGRYLATAGVAIAFDLAMAAIFAAYLWRTRRANGQR